MKNTATLSSYTSLSLKIMGVVLMLSSLLDYIVLAIPPDLENTEWQIDYIRKVVDLGIVPMVGMAFVLVGYWIGGTLQNTKSVKKSPLDFRLPIFILASLLGLIFLLFVPLHINNIRIDLTSKLETINQSATEAEERIQNQYDRINDILNNSNRINQLDNQLAQINQALNQGQIQGRPLNARGRTELEQSRQQLQNLRQLAENPEALSGRLNELQTQLRTQRLDRESRIKTTSLKGGIRIGCTSLMLAVGYIIIGWFGLKEITTTVPTQKKA